MLTPLAPSGWLPAAPASPPHVHTPAHTPAHAPPPLLPPPPATAAAAAAGDPALAAFLRALSPPLAAPGAVAAALARHGVCMAHLRATGAALAGAAPDGGKEYLFSTLCKQAGVSAAAEQMTLRIALVCLPPAV